MKLVSQYLEKIEHVEFFPILSMLLFFGFFIIIGIWVYKLPKNYIKEMENWPNSEEVEPNEKYTPVGHDLSKEGSVT